MIREYKESDFPGIEKIYNLSKADEFSEESFNVVVTPLSEDKKMLDLFHSSNIYIYKAVGIAGFIGVKENYISWLFVHPSYRSQGIGKKLVSFILSASNGDVTLNVARSNFIAKNMYESLGFKVTKELTGNYQENPLIVCRMVAQAKNG
jgi:ribosomal protein S18 acetylase RimI-like enzyme